MDSIIILRLYATPSRYYACIWVSSNPFYVSGGGYAGGYGYHKASAAAQAAMEDAGINLDFDISGRGDSAIRDGLMAIGEALGVRKPAIFEAHA